eukprot:scaffold43151_cov22-Tisochrysis_lutea.AAC.1
MGMRPWHGHGSRMSSRWCVPLSHEGDHLQEPTIGMHPRDKGLCIPQPHAAADARGGVRAYIHSRVL